MSADVQLCYPSIVCTDLVETIIRQLTEDPCSNFRHPNGPSDELLISVPSMASFASAAVTAGIEHDNMTSTRFVLKMSLETVHPFKVRYLV